MVGVERPGGGRIRDKRPPAPEDVIEVIGVREKRLKVHRRAWDAYWVMRVAAWTAGVDPRRLLAHSILRDAAVQARLCARAVKKYGSEREARRWVAPPGKSAHESGRAFDLDLDGGALTSARAAEMRTSGAYQWLRAHAVEFGFYPYGAEPWHWEWNPPGPEAACGAS